MDRIFRCYCDICMQKVGFLPSEDNKLIHIVDISSDTGGMQASPRVEEKSQDD